MASFDGSGGMARVAANANEVSSDTKKGMDGAELKRSRAVIESSPNSKAAAEMMVVLRQAEVKDINIQKFAGYVSGTGGNTTAGIVDDDCGSTTVDMTTRDEALPEHGAMPYKSAGTGKGNGKKEGGSERDGEDAMDLKTSSLSDLKITEEDTGELRSKGAYRWQNPHDMVDSMTYGRDKGGGEEREEGKEGLRGDDKDEQNRNKNEDWKEQGNEGTDDKQRETKEPGEGADGQGRVGKGKGGLWRLAKKELRGRCFERADVWKMLLDGDIECHVFAYEVGREAKGGVRAIELFRPEAWHHTMLMADYSTEASVEDVMNLLTKGEMGLRDTLVIEKDGYELTETTVAVAIQLGLTDKGAQGLHAKVLRGGGKKMAQTPPSEIEDMRDEERGGQVGMGAGVG